MVRHLVDYVAIVELIADDTHDLDLDDDTRPREGSGVQGRVLQRFPKEDWEGFAFPEDGIVKFCQPGGWKTYNSPRPPECFNFIFTNGEGAYTYATCLSVFETCNDILENQDCIDVDDDLKPSFFYRSDSKRASLATGSELPQTFYGPKCFTILSSFPFYNTFRECLCELYSRFIEDSKVMNETKALTGVENIIATLLATEVPEHQSIERPLIIDLEGRAINVERLNPPSQPPYTGTSVYNLVSTIGIGHTLQLVSAMITDHKIMFISSNYSSLLSAANAARSIIYPLTIRHYVFVPVLPNCLLAVVGSPTPYVTGIHVSSHNFILQEGFVGQTVIVDIDSGILKIPQDIEMEIPPLPTAFRNYLTHCLKLILDPKYLLSDLAYAPPPRTISPPALQDKEIRAVFMQFFSWMLAQYRCCLIVVRSHPKPVIVFNDKRFLEIRSFQNEQIVLRLFDTMSFLHFIEDYGPPYRVSTLFDDLARGCSVDPPRCGPNQDQKLPTETRELAQRLLENEACMGSVRPTKGPPENIDEVKFPRLREYRVSELLENYGISLQSRKPSITVEPYSQEPRSIIKDRALPGEVLPYRTAKKKQELRKMNNALLNCLTAMFSNQIFNARKILPKARYALAYSSVRNNFVAELNKIPNSSTSLSHSQFDILAVLINTALENDKGVDAGDFAIKIMPLTDKFCRQLQYGTVQFIYTCVQHHSIWQNVAFWERAFYCIVQQHILEVFETMEKDGKLNLSHHDASLHNGHAEEKHAQSMQEISQRALIHSALRLLSWGDWNADMHDEVKTQEETTIIGQVRHFCSRIIWLLVPLNINHEDDGTSFNNMAEIDNLDHFAFNDPSSPLSKEARRSLDKHEIIEIVEKFVDNIVMKCNVKHYSEIDKIRTIIPEMFTMHCETLEDVSTHAAKLPPVEKTTFLKARTVVPPLVNLERILADPVHVYMMPIPSNGSIVQPQILPAEGVLYLTNYRIIFRGYPRNSDDENTVIYRTMPIGSIYTLTTEPERSNTIEDNDRDDPFDDFLCVEQELHISSLTCQLFRIGFFNEQSYDGVEQFKRKLIQRRKVTKIVHTFAYVRPEPEPLDGARGSRSHHHHHKNRKSMLVNNPQKNTSTSSAAPTITKRERSKVEESPKSPSGRLKASEGLSHSPSMASLVSNGDEHSENMSLVSGLTSTSIFGHSGSFRIKRTKKRQVLRYRPEFSYCEDFARLGFGGFNDIGKTSTKGPWRLTAENKDYNLCRSYPAILIVPSLSSDIELHNVARQFDRNRFPVISWRHPKRAATILMRSASIVRRGVMDKISAAHKTFTYKVKGNQARPSTDLPDNGFRSEHTENYLNVLVHSIKQLQANCKTTAYNPHKSKNHHLQKFLFRGMTKLKENFTMSSEKLFSGYSASQAALSHIPEGDTMSQLLEEEEENTKITLFVIGRYHDLKNARMENYTEVEMIGIEDMHYREVARSFELLMAALHPESEKSDFWTQIENSNWLEQIQKILEISCSLVELMDRWGVSVLLALEDGSNITAQISSLIQLLTDKHYRTIKGFNMLIEKEWLSFGHRFSLHGRQTNEKEDNFAPIFLQFLDTVYQIHRQFPHCFEFNEFYLESLAYHHCSMRFRTFVCDSEKKRAQALGIVRMEDDSRTSTPEVTRRSSSVSSTYENNSYSDDSHSFWTYVESLKKSGPLFYNYLYRPTNAEHVLRPNIHLAALELWSYYTRDDMMLGTAYEPDLWVVKKGKDKKPVPVSSKEQVSEGLGEVILNLTELRLNRGNDDVQVDSPWLQTLYTFNLDSHYKPAKEALALTNRTKLRRRLQQANVQSLASGKVRVNGHRFELYNYNPFTEPEKLPCVICEGNPEIPARSQLTIRGLKCCYCQITIHTICQLFVTTTCKKRETEEDTEPIPRSQTIKGRSDDYRKSRILIPVSRSATQPDLSSSQGANYDQKSINENHAAANQAPMSSPRRNGREDGNIEATLLKKGGILKTWRKWRFELNVKLKELRYYESASDAHNPLYIRKTIDLRGRVKVTPLSHSGVSNRDSSHPHHFPFMIKTERRDLVLAADTKELRDIWMKKIKSVSQAP
ncbi:hypothetical protein ACHWQZ_G015591 [Mnemiopsis leidyi]